MTEAKHWNAAVCIGVGALFGAVITALGVNALSADAGAWLSFAGSIVGGGMTLVAGWIAWTAAQQQMAEARRPELERARRAKTFLSQYAKDWSDAIYLINDFVSDINIEAISRNSYRIGFESSTLEAIRRQCEIASSYISPDLIHNITDYIDPDTYLAFVELNGDITDFRRSESECRRVMGAGYETTDGEIFGSQELGDAFDLLVELARLCATRVEALKQALSKGD